MTAYKNRKAALAVTAGLVGALTLGGAAVAVTPAFAEDGASMQADWNAPDTYISAATNGKGQAVANPKDASFPAASGQYLVPTAVKNKFGFEKSFTNPTGYNFCYEIQRANGSWGTVAWAWNGKFGDADAFFGSNLATKATYRVTVSTPDGTVNASQTFKLVNPSVEGITVADSITYDGASTWQNKDLGVVDANKNHLANGPDYKVSNVEDANGNWQSTTGLIHAGTYKVTIDGVNAYAGTSATVTITVNPLDLSKAVVTVPDYNGTVYYSAVNYDVNVLGYKGNKDTQQPLDIKLTGLTDPAGRLVNNTLENFDAWQSDASGKYVATVKAADGNPDVTGEAEVAFHKYDVAAGDLYYGKSTVLATSLGSTGYKAVDLTAGESFDASKLAIRDRGNLYQAGFDVSYVDAVSGKTVDASALSKPGTYHVLVHAKMTKNSADQVVCGYYRFDVEVLGNKLNAFADVAFIWDGELATSNSGNATYDGTDQLSRLTTMVVDGDHNSYVEGKDYELTVKKAGYGEPVKEAVDAGTYTVTVTPKTFEFSGSATFTLTINPVKVSDLGRKTGLKDQTVTYTGSELEVPQAQYLVVNADGSKEYKPLDKALYKVDTIKDAKTGKVAKLQKAGKYAVTISLTDAAKGNFQLVDRDFIVTVREATSFDDVAADAWYAGPVEKAYDNGYVNGFAGTRLFGPERQITRADAVCILFNMAGGKDMSDGLFDYNASTGYETGFKDVNGKAYYAKALAWANETDVANGYGDGTFKPEAQITREEFAALLSNYAKLKGEYKAPTGDLSSFEDASSVSGWATEVVEWAVENGVLGNGGFLAGDAQITRAEVAAMAVNYQPKPVKNPVFSKFDK